MKGAEKPLLDSQDVLGLIQLLKEAVALHQSGKLAEAASLYLRILKIKPDYWHAQRPG